MQLCTSNFCENDHFACILRMSTESFRMYLLYVLSFIYYFHDIRVIAVFTLSNTLVFLTVLLACFLYIIKYITKDLAFI